MSSLLVPSIQTLVAQSLSSTEFGDTSKMTGLVDVTLQWCHNLITLPTFSNSTNMTTYYVYQNEAVTSIEGPWPATTNALTVALNYMPLVTFVPSFEAVNLTELHLIQLGITSFPTLPTIPSVTYIDMSNLPNLAGNLPASLADQPLVQFSIQFCPLLSQFVPHFNLDILLGINLAMGLNEVPDWFCSASNLIFIGLGMNNLSTIPTCLATSFPNLMALSLIDAGSSIQTIPSGIFQIQTLQQLYIFGLPGLVIDNALKTTTWNLPNANQLVLPGSFVTNFVPPIRSLIGGNITLGQGLRVSFLEIVNGSIPDLYFDSFANMTQLSASGLALTGTIPSSLSKAVNMSVLILAGNSLTGTLPQFIAEFHLLSQLVLPENQLYGPVPNFTACSNLVYLNLQNNYFDFCQTTGGRLVPSSAGCLISGLCTNGANAPAAHSSCSFFCTTPPAQAATCGGAPYPTPGYWICRQNVWITPSSICTNGSLELFSSNAIVEGNLKIDQVLFSNASTLTVTGCVNTSSVNVTIGPADAAHLLDHPLPLLVQSGANCPSLSSLPTSLTVLANGTCYDSSIDTSASQVSVSVRACPVPSVTQASGASSSYSCLPTLFFVCLMFALIGTMPE